MTDTLDGRGRLTKAQIRRLLKPLRADRVEQKQGLAYVPQHEVRAELIRIFGPGNVDHTMTEPKLLFETSQQGNNKGEHPEKTYYTACYLVGCTLRIRDYHGRPVAEFTEYHAEANSILPDRGEAHAMAVTSAESYALRRAAISLGDAFGLHLYNGGSLAAFIGGTIQLEGDLDSPLALPDEESAINARMRNPQQPPANQATGEVTETAAPQTPARTRKAAARVKAQDDAAEAPDEAPAPAQTANVPNIDDAFKKPTRTRQVKPAVVNE